MMSTAVAAAADKNSQLALLHARRQKMRESQSSVKGSGK